MANLKSEQETARQYRFMELMREITVQEEKEYGRKQRYFIETLGCQMNAKDSEKLAGILRKIGYEQAENEEQADFILYNTCTVRENANTRMYGRLGQLSALKNRKKDLRIAVCGCMMQEPDEVDTIRRKYHFVDIVFGTHNIFKLAELMYRMKTEDGMVIDVWEGTDEIVEDLPAVRKYSFKSGVNIMYGCNNFCSYCIVPYVRGRERSREKEDILKEIRMLSRDGVKEVMLLGQNVNSYGKTLGSPVSFAELLREVCTVDGIERVRFMTSHPKDLSDDLIEVMAEEQKVCNHFHLPLQSGSNRILERMNRRYTREKYLEITEKLRRRVPGISLTTDLIVGFPGETEADFQDTLDLVRRVRYDSAFTFIYSKRTGTPAAAMPDQIPEEVQHDRLTRLLALVQEIGREESGRDRGRTLPVLAEEINRQDPSMLTGRLTNNTVVHFKGDPSLIGQIVPVTLEESRGFYYIGRLDQESRA